MVTFQTNRYSVPVAHAGDALLLRAFVDRVEITDGTRVIAVHERCYGREQDILDVFHYLPLLKKRPGALDHAKPLNLIGSALWYFLYIEHPQSPKLLTD